MNTEEKFVEDPRFKLCFKEAVIAYVFFFVFFVAVMAATYGFGKELVLGLPLWFLMAAIVIPLIFIAVLYFLTEKVFDDTPLDPYLDQEEVK